MTVKKQLENASPENSGRLNDIWMGLSTKPLMLIAVPFIDSDSVEDNVTLGAAINRGMPKSIMKEQAALIKFMMTAGVLPRSTLDDAKKSKKDTLSPANSERIVRAMRMRKQIVDALGEDRADAWLEKPNKNFGGQSAIELAKTEAGARAVEQFLLQLTHGFNA
jgi:putative toxin-antitoxin system antitoxin component (TIGR02293 family)